jgi:hypothetical protein
VVYRVNDGSTAAGSGRALERRVAALAREIAETINTGQGEEREGLRDLAVNLLRDEVQVIELPRPVERQSAGSFNPFGIGIPFVLMGMVLVFLFPLVGLLMFAAAAVMIAWGVGTTLLARSRGS